MIKVGDRVLYTNYKGEEVIETVRLLFDADILLMPYAPNESVPAAVLTHYSWTRLENLREIP